jgi:hypothetical protein
MPSLEWVCEMHFSFLILYRSWMHSIKELGGAKKQLHSRPLNRSHVAIPAFSGMGARAAFSCFDSTSERYALNWGIWIYKFQSRASDPSHFAILPVN